MKGRPLAIDAGPGMTGLTLTNVEYTVRNGRVSIESGELAGVLRVWADHVLEVTRGEPGPSPAQPLMKRWPDPGYVLETTLVRDDRGRVIGSVARQVREPVA